MTARYCLLTLLLAFGTCGAARAGVSAPLITDLRIGFNNHYKVGHWTPIWIEVGLEEPLADGQVAVTVSDSDGVATSTRVPLVNRAPWDGHASATAYTRVGRVTDPIAISVFDGDDLIAERTLPPGSSWSGERIDAMPSMAELQVALGESAHALLTLLGDRGPSGARPQRRIARPTQVAALPSEWFGYESVNVLVISGSDPQPIKELAADAGKWNALVRWIELGGRVVILCGGENAKELLAEGGPLAPLLPGTFADVARLPETGPLEFYARTDAPVAAVATRIPIAVPRLVNVTGSIEAHGGRRPTDLPLVVRAARGLGEITFVGLDFTSPPLSEWEGRRAFLQAVLRPYQAATEVADAGETLVTRGYDDLSGALRQRLGRSFRGVTPMTFPLIAVLAFAYVLVLGPLDYLIVHRWLGRPLAAWITFPIAVLLFGIGAMALAEWRSASAGPRVNQVELVDVDTTTGLRRGTYWAAVYSPSANQRDLRLAVDPRLPLTDPAHVLLSWWGLPGTGIGGMQARFANLVNVRTGYEYVPAAQQADQPTAGRGNMLRGVPILTASTKSFTARWTGRGEPLVAAQLVDQDGLAAGYLENQTGQPLRNARLLYNGWGYRLGHLAPGQRVDVNEQLRPRSARTLLTLDALGATAGGRERTVFVPEQASIPELLTLMMFHDAAGGTGFSHLPSEYQGDLDLSRLLAMNRAVLVTDVPAGGSRLVGDDNRSLGTDQGTSLLIYRFVLPVAPLAPAPTPTPLETTPPP